MRYLLSISAFLISTLSSLAQYDLDTSRLALFGDGEITIHEIKIADSILIESVNYYNLKSSRGYNLISLNDNEYKEYKRLDSLNRLIIPYLNRKDRIRKSKLKNLDKSYKEEILKIISNKDSLRQSIKTLKEKGKPNRDDSLVSFWGSVGYIDIASYYRQYSYYKDSNGNYQIRVSCFCPNIIETMTQLPNESKLDWRKWPLKVYDGGSCVFTIRLDLGERKANWMKVNGI